MLYIRTVFLLRVLPFLLFRFRVLGPLVIPLSLIDNKMQLTEITSIP